MEKNCKLNPSEDGKYYVSDDEGNLVEVENYINKEDVEDDEI